MSSNSITKLFVAAFTFSMICPLSLDAMEYQQESLIGTVANQSTSAQQNDSMLVLLVCNHMISIVTKGKGVPDVSKYICYLYIISSGIDEIEQKYNCSSGLINAILRVSSECGPDLTAEIVSMALTQAGVSLFDIKYNFGWTPLHYSVACGATSATKILLIVAQKYGDDELREFVCMKDNFGHTALYSSNCYVDAVKELCAVTDKRDKDKGWTLLCERGDRGDTVVHYAAHCGWLKLFEALVAYVETLGEGKVWELCIKKNYNGSTAWDCAWQKSTDHYALRKIIDWQKSTDHYAIRKIIEKYRPIDTKLCLVKFYGKV